MSLDKLLISTTLGDALVRSSDRVYVKIHSNQFIRKRARDVEEGESALWHKNKTGTRFRDIEPFLVHSPRYRHSLDFIKEQNEQGKYVNKLRALIIRGLAKRKVVSSENLEDRILNNYGGGDRPMDFSGWEIDMMTKYLVDFMDGRGDPISSWQARNWVRGKTVAPFIWDHFETLSSLNPEFKKWKKHKQKRDSIYFNYRLHMVVRQQIERKLSEYLGKQWGGSGEEYETFITVNPEYRLIINHFLDEHTDVLRDPSDFQDELVFARVNKKTRVRKQIQETAIRENDRLLTDGLHLGRHPLLETTAISYPEVVEHKRVVDRLLEAVIEKTLLRVHEDFDLEVYEQFYLGTYLRRNYLINKLKREYRADSPNDSLYQIHLNWQELQEPEHRERGLELYNLFKEFMIEGRVDKDSNLPHGTSMRLIEIAFKLDLGIPVDVKRYLYEVVEYDGDLEAKRLDQEQNKGKKLKKLVRDCKRISSRFDISLGYTEHTLRSKIFFSDIIVSPLLGYTNNRTTQMAESQGLVINQYLDTIADDPEALREFYGSETVYAPDTPVFTREETLGTLHKYQLSDFIHLIEEDFHYQKFVEDGKTPKSQWGELNQKTSMRDAAERAKRIFG